MMNDNRIIHRSRSNSNSSTRRDGSNGGGSNSNDRDGIDDDDDSITILSAEVQLASAVVARNPTVVTTTTIAIDDGHGGQGGRNDAIMMIDQHDDDPSFEQQRLGGTTTTTSPKSSSSRYSNYCRYNYMYCCRPRRRCRCVNMKKKPSFFAIMIALLVVVAVTSTAILVWLLLPSNSSNSGGTPTMTSNDDENDEDASSSSLDVYAEYIKGVLAPYLILKNTWDNPYTILTEPTSPYRDALLWMAYEDGLAGLVIMGCTTENGSGSSGSSSNDIHHDDGNCEGGIGGDYHNDHDDDDDDDDHVFMVRQRFAILLLYFGTGGVDFWDSEWIYAGQHECEFSGVVCDSNNHIIELNLSQRSMVGPIPPESIAWLSATSLRILDLSQNRLGGTIPLELFIPPSLDRPSSSSSSSSSTVGSVLEVIRLHSNEFEGTIPPDLRSLRTLRELNLSNNYLTGPLPQYYSTAVMEEMILELNFLTGGIPITWFYQHHHQQQSVMDDDGTTINITNITANNNGTNNTDDDGTTTTAVPTPFSDDQYALRFLTISYNPLGGTIPTEIGLLSNLVSFGMTTAQVYGTIPTEISSMKSLVDLSFSDNQLSGYVPWEELLIGSKKLEWIVLTANQLSGSISSSSLVKVLTTLSPNIPSLIGLTVIRNKLTGTIPSEFGNFQRLERLQLSNNRLTGTIPTDALERLLSKDETMTDGQDTGSSRPLTELWLTYNRQLTGIVPCPVQEEYSDDGVVTSEQTPPEDAGTAVGDGADGNKNRAIDFRADCTTDKVICPCCFFCA